MNKQTPQFVIIGQVLRSHALHGAVKARIIPDAEEQFLRLRQVLLRRGEQALGTYAIEKLQNINDGFLVKFREINDRDQAESLRGAELVIALEACESAGPDQFYHFDLIGLPVFSASDEPLGEVVDILHYPANDVWVIRQGGAEKLVPAIDAVIQKVDLPNRRIVITPLPGLFDE